MAAFALQVLAILLYPGLVAAAVAGLLAELAVRRRTAATLRTVLRPNAAMLAGAGLAGLAGAQLAAPLSLADPGDRNLLVAVIALSVLAALGWATGSGQGGTLLLAGLVAMALALLTPAVLAQDLHPQVLAVAGFQVAAARAPVAILYVAGLGVLLPALTGSPLRLWVWLAAGGLFTSVFVPPVAGDLLGLLVFYGATTAVIAAAALFSRLIAQVL